MWCSYLRGEGVKSVVSKVSQRGQAFSVRGFPCLGFVRRVGGARKGFHAVAIKDGKYSSHMVTTDVQRLSGWCIETVNARVISVDAPCRWSIDGRARPAERALMGMGIWCFSTPTRQGPWLIREIISVGCSEARRCIAHLHRRTRWSPDFQCPAEGAALKSFPHAITWHMRGGNADASRKRAQRRALLEAAEIDLTMLTNIDLVDAALCALAAYRAATGGACVSFGEPGTGLIIVPARQNQ